VTPSRRVQEAHRVYLGRAPELDLPLRRVPEQDLAGDRDAVLQLDPLQPRADEVPDGCVLDAEARGEECGTQLVGERHGALGEDRDVVRPRPQHHGEGQEVRRRGPPASTYGWR
jgi:hypothetical protein